MKKEVEKYEKEIDEYINFLNKIIMSSKNFKETIVLQRQRDWCLNEKVKIHLLKPMVTVIQL